MTRLALILVPLLTGCGWLAANPTAQTVVTSLLDAAISEAARAVNEASGKALHDVPTTCEVEHVPAQRRVLMLCEMDYGKVGR